jgi:aminoglycoside phosphotransferase family enzyme
LPKNELINDLQEPAALPEPTNRVSVVQTHISIVFIADDFVYKVKKAVDFGFLDFSTLQKREFFCHQEVELNRRLSTDIYLDVLPIKMDGGKYTLRPVAGETVEFAVKMKRIPDHFLMKTVFEKGQVTKPYLEEIASVLAEFHRKALSNEEIEEFGLPQRFKVNTDENFDQVEQYIGKTISETDFEDISRWTADFYTANDALFKERIRMGRIKDCHGDLHMEHICLMEGLPIIDCIEFNERFRYSDTVADIAFLLMDLEYHGGEELAETLWNAYKSRAEEHEVDDLLVFYKVYRAFVRGKVNSFQLGDPSIDSKKKAVAVETAQMYFELARSYIRP